MTSNIEIISASAGSGKTTRLAEELRRSIEANVRPEAIIATTFTRKAAASLETRVRTMLIQAGRPEEAQRLAAARIGTINAICGAFVADYAFELGLSPDLRVLDDESSTAALEHSLTSTFSSPAAAAELDELEELQQRMKAFEWRDAVRKIQAVARANRMSADDLPACAARSTVELLGLLGPPVPDGRVLDQDLRNAAESFVNGVTVDEGLTKKTSEVVERARSLLAGFRGGSSPAWADWCSLADREVGKRERTLFEPVKLAAVRHDVHPRLRQDLTRAIELCFDLARRSLTSYEEHKKALGALDFVDQEALMLTLLDRPDVRERIREDVQLVLVDEFQDTSPLQLAIFLKLAELVPRSVWVGDQKQAIYSFRGADPSLMEAAIETILGGREPEALGFSWRSRPELVRATSRFFEAAFEPQGLPPARVHLEPGHPSEPDGLGPIFERWSLRSRNERDDVRAVASALTEAIADPSVRVRDPKDGSVRAPRPGDFAVLCRSNKRCAEVADELRRHGLRAVLALPLFGTTHEQRLLLVGLRLWVDPEDALAKAELARLVAYPADGDGWLDHLLEPGKRYAKAFDALEALQRLRARREASPHLGPVAALDAVLETLDVREQCLSWGDATERLANVESLRARAFRYAAACTQAGTAATPAGLLVRFFDREDLETAPVPPDSPDAVVVSTWHRAKGLEWPITVLFELNSHPQAAMFDVYVEPRPEGIRLEDPLAGRWICFWPNPYSAGLKKSPLYSRLDSHALKVRRDRERLREEMRLAYVGWTRARDRVVLAAREGKIASGLFESFKDGTGNPLLDEPLPDGSWPSLSAKARLRVLEPIGPNDAVRAPGEGYVAKGVVPYPAAFVSPSSLAGIASSAIVTTIGDRLPISGHPDLARLGAAVHSFLAADLPRLPQPVRLELAQGLLDRWQVPAALAPGDLLAASDALGTWIAGRWPEAIWQRELPIGMALPEGGVLHGFADLVLDLGDRFVLIDHKSYPGTTAEAIERAKGHAGQLAAYARTLERCRPGSAVELFIHLPMLGLVMGISGLTDSPVRAESTAPATGTLDAESTDAPAAGGKDLVELAEPVAVGELRTAVDQAALQYHRLVFLASASGQGKTRLLRALAAELPCPLVNLNLRLTERLLDLTRRQRALETGRLVREILDATGSSTVALDNIEVLFSRELAQDALVLLRGLARNRTLVVAWPGTILEGVLAYAEPGHPEYRRYPRPDGVLIQVVPSGAPGPAAERPASG